MLQGLDVRVVIVGVSAVGAAHPRLGLADQNFTRGGVLFIGVQGSGVRQKGVICRVITWNL